MSSKKYKKEKTNENIFRAARKFTDAFFDGLKTGAADRVIKQAQRAGVRQDAIDRMEQIKRDKEELERILADIPEA